MSSSTFVDQLYRQILGREPDAEGHTFWFEQLDSGVQNAADVTQAFVQSTEYSELVAPIVRLYLSALGRTPDAEGLAYWVQQVHAGRSLQEICVSFADTDEYRQLYDSAQDDNAFVEQLYQNAMGRAPAGDGTIYWQNGLDTGSLSRVDVLVGFVSSQAMAEARADEVDIIAQYHGTLNRAPTQAEVDSALGSGDPVGQITQLYANQQYRGEVVPGLSQAGVVVDGYVSGATVTMTLSDGTVRTTTTDENGNFDFGAEAGFGKLVMTGGTDISTGQPFEGTMTAPAGATVVNPITTLIDQYTDIRYGSSPSPKKLKKAKKAVLEKLGLETSVDALNFDPMKEASRTDTDSAATENALKFQAAATQINTLVTQVAALLEGAGAAADEAVGGDAAIRALAEIVTTDTVDLSSTETIKQVTSGAAGKAGADSGSQARVDALADEAAQTVANLNQAIQNAVDSAGTDHTGALQEIAQVQVVAESVEDKLESGAANDDLTTARESTEGSQFTEAVAAEKDNVSVKDGVGAVYQPQVTPDTDAPTATLSYSTDTGLSDDSSAGSTLAVKQGDTLRIFARFNEGIRDVDGATLSVHDGQSETVSAAAMVKVSTTLYYYDFAVPTGDFTGTVTIGAATDGANNTISAAPTNATFTVDNTAPVITLSSLSLSDDTGSDSSDAVTKTAGQTVSATLSQVLAVGDSVYGSVDGGSHWTDITDKVSGTSLSWDGVNLSNGSHSLQLHVRDAVGNEGAVAGLAYTLDTEAPTIATLTVSTDDQVSTSDTLSAVAFGGTTTGVEDGQQVMVDIAGVSATATVSNSSFNGTIDLSSVGDSSNLPVTVDVSDLAGNAATQFSKNVAKDSSAPVISGVVFSPTTGTLKIGDSLTATITADASGYSAGAISINDKAVTGFTDNNDNTYSVTYTVAAGDTDIADSSQIPLSVVLSDAADNSNSPYTTAPVAGSAPAVDAAAPVISGVVLSPTTGTLKIGDSLTATITADASGYSAGAITINGKAVTGFTDNNDNTYSVTYTVAAGDTDIADSSQIPLSVVLSDAAGNSSSPYTTAPAANSAPAVDAAAPVISGVVLSPTTGTLKIGDSLTATITADASGYSAGAITINGKAVTGFADNNDNTYSVTYTVAAGDTDIADSSQIPLSVVLSDAAGNSNSPYTTAPAANSAPAVDAAAPVISGVVFSPTTGTLKIGDSLTATITADAAGYSAGAITINGKAVTGFTDNNDNTYSVTYTVAAGDTDIADSSQIPLSVVLSDAAGNNSSAYTTAPGAGDAPAVDANAPGIATLVVSGDDKVNSSDTLTAVAFSGTTTGVEDNQQVTVNIAGASATATVTGSSFSGTIDLASVSDGSSLAVTANVSDQAGNAATQFSKNLMKDSAAPLISSVVFSPSTGALKIGSTLTATITADASGYSAGAITINGKAVTGFTDNNDNTYSVTYTVAEGDTDIADSSQIPISVVLTDAAGNSNSAFTTAPAAGNAPSVDASAPSITTLVISSDDKVNSSDTLNAVTFSGTTTGVEDNQEVTVVIAGISSKVNVTGNSFSGTVDLSSVGDSSTLGVTADVSDQAGNAAIQFNNTIVKDVLKPGLSSSNPTNNAQNVLLNSNIVLTFDENITLGSGDIVISDGSDIVRIDVENNSGQLAINGKTLTIDPTADLANGGVTYNVQVDNGAIIDVAGNPLSATSLLSFGTKQAITSLSYSAESHYDSVFASPSTFTDGVVHLTIGGHYSDAKYRTMFDTNKTFSLAGFGSDDVITFNHKNGWLGWNENVLTKVNGDHLRQHKKFDSRVWTDDIKYSGTKIKIYTNYNKGYSPEPPFTITLTGLPANLTADNIVFI